MVLANEISSSPYRSNLARSNDFWKLVVSDPYKVRKTVIRTNLLFQRNSMSAEEVSTRSINIQSNLVKMSDYADSEIIGNYIAIGTEVETFQIMKRAFCSNKIVGLPTVAGDNLSYYRIQYEDLVDKLITHPRFKIREPIADKSKLIEKIDLLIVPGIAFDIKGNRIGYGYGYYDKYMAKKTYKKAIGLAYDFQILNHVPSIYFDKKIDIIVSEKRIIFC